MPSASTAQKRRAGMPFILVVVFIDVLGIGIALPVLPILVGEYTASRELQTYWYGALVVVYGVMQFVCAPVLGALSDRFGRRPLLLWSLLGLGLHFLLLGLAPSLAVMFVARVVGGASGASFSVANAYASDVSTAEQRAKSFGLVGAAFGLGFIFGPMVGGLLGSVNLHLPFYAAAGLSLVNAVYGFFIVPESLPSDRRSPFSLRQGESFRRAADPRPSSRDRQPGHRVCAGRAGAIDVADQLGALHPLPIRMGAARERLCTVLRRLGGGGRARRLAGNVVEALRQHAPGADRARDRNRRLCSLRPRAAGMDDVRRSSSPTSCRSRPAPRCRRSSPTPWIRASRASPWVRSTRSTASCSSSRP